MGRTILTATFAVALSFLSQSFALAQRADKSLRHAHSLLAEACKLHSLLESAGTDAFTIRSACRLESSAEELIEKLSCPSNFEHVDILMDDCILWYKRTYIGVRRDCHLAQNHLVASTLSCAGRQVALLEDSIECLLHHGGQAEPLQHPNWFAPQSGDVPQPGFVPQPLSGHPGTWVNGPIAVPALPALLRSPGYPFGSEGFGEPGVPQTSIRQWSDQLPPLTQQFAPNHATPNQRGQIARAVLEVVLSQLSR